MLTGVTDPRRLLWRFHRPACNRELWLNGRGAALLGRPGDAFPKALPLREGVAEADSPRAVRRFRRTTLKPGSGVSIIVSAVRKDGSTMDLELTGTVGAGRGEIRTVAVADDMTEKVRDDARLSYLAFSDGLTGLANRTLLFDRLRQSLPASRRTGNGFALPAPRRTQARYRAAIVRASPIAASTKAGRGTSTSSLRCCP